ncbi:discoidin domain-containing protein [Actinoplanes sp. L3-i22]|uniref:discoidin domain-containing protein n=1 Tax=Actinoplanes sp. L3-i22 TaxID=2836373 RepID=UPI001C78AB75|nr:discoidin domain-containing protein [Actinoplanes sp. L3-i22]BCY10447.1 hypothetical protein L3i22_055350 [Actinoplanes sp. L3-i22]
MAESDDERRSRSRAENLRLTRMPSLPPRPGPAAPLTSAPPPPPPPPPPAVPAPRRRGRSGLLAGLLVLVAAAGAGVAYRWQSDAAASPAPSAPTTFPAVSGPAEEPSGPAGGPVAAAGSPAPLPPTAPPAPIKSAQPAGKPNPAGANLALRGVCTASGSESDPWLPKYACDGDPDTRWSSAFTSTQWIRADLRAPWRLTSVTLVWERSYGASYRVETSLDGKKWTKIYSTTTGRGGTEEIPAKGAVARYVRMVGLKRVSEYGYSLLEFEIR